MKIRIDINNPLTRGPLTLFPLFADEPEAGPYLSGPEAAERKLFDVRERGEGAIVAELEIENRADVALLLVEGEVLLGAKQNRTLNVSVLCKPLGVTVIPVSCVEAGRWGKARSGGHSKYHAGLSLRTVKTRSVSASLRATGTRHSDQSAVWDAVTQFSRKTNKFSASSDYDEILSGVKTTLEELTTGLEPADGQCGVLVGIGGRVRALDLFDRHSTLRAYWKSLLAGYASDAIEAPSLVTPASLATKFLDEVIAAKLEERDGAGLGRELHVDTNDLAVAALRWATATVHLAAFASSFEDVQAVDA